MTTTSNAFDALSTIAALAALTAFTKESTVSVYSGKNGKCCCGCAGNYRLNSRHYNVGDTRHGYAVTADEINDAQVTRVLRTITSATAASELEFGERHVARVVNGRLFVAYLAD